MALPCVAVGAPDTHKLSLLHKMFSCLQVVAHVQVLGKGYSHPDGRVAASAVLFNEVLQYVPQTPKERIACLDY